MASRADETRFSRWMADELGLADARLGLRLGGGNSNVTQLVHCAQGDLVLRRPPDNAISESAANGVRREHRILSALAGRAPVPRVIGFCSDRAVIGQPFILTEHIDGVSITTSLPPAYSPGTATLRRVGEELIDALAAIHGVEWEPLGLDRPVEPQDYTRKQIERWLKVRTAHSVRDLPLIAELGRWLLERLPPPPPPRIVHGDFHLDNSLFGIDAPQLKAVIDWELSTIGDPLADLGLLLVFWGPRAVDTPGFSFVQAVSRVPGVVSRTALAERWSRRTGLSAEHLPYYCAFALWRLAAIVEGAYVLYRKGLVSDDYSRSLGEDVPRLLEEAAIAAGIR